MAPNHAPAPPPPTGPAISPQPSVAGALAALGLATLLSSLGTSIANVALPALAEAFAAPFPRVQWIVLAYLLTLTTLIVSAGRLGDLFGRRRLLLTGLALFTIASALCAAAPTLPLLIAARALQGLGAAVMMALTLALVSETVPRNRTGRAMGLLGTLSAVGTALGPSLGGVLVAGFGWRAVFLAMVPLGLLALFITGRRLPADRPAAPQQRRRLDLPGTLLLAGTLAAYALAMTNTPGTAHGPDPVLLLTAALGAGLFLRVETRATAPLIAPALLRDTAFTAGLAMNAAVATVMMTTLVVGPFYLSRALGLSAAGVGLVLAIGPALSTACGVIAGRLVDRHGPPAMTLLGLIGMATGTSALTLLPPLFGLAGYGAGIILLTPGYQLFQAANNTAIMTDVPPDRRGVVSGMLNLSRNLGLITGAAVMGAVFTAAAGTTDPTTAPAAAPANGLRLTFAVATALILAAIALAAVGRARTLRPQPAGDQT